MAFMGSGEKGRAAVNIKSKETNNYYQGRGTGKDIIKDGVVKSVRHNAQADGGINRAAKGSGAAKREY